MEKPIDSLKLNVRVIYDFRLKSLKIDFSNDFYVHREVLNSMNYYFEQALAGKVIDDVKIFEACTWLHDYLDLAAKINLAKTDHFTGSIKIGKSY